MIKIIESANSCNERWLHLGLLSISKNWNTLQIPHQYQISPQNTTGLNCFLWHKCAIWHFQCDKWLIEMWHICDIFKEAYLWHISMGVNVTQRHKSQICHFALSVTLCLVMYISCFDRLYRSHLTSFWNILFVKDVSHLKAVLIRNRSQEGGGGRLKAKGGSPSGRRINFLL